MRGAGQPVPRFQKQKRKNERMNKYVYNGADVNLGRFGAVRSGDVLTLTDHEADTIAKDKRFQPLRDGDKKKNAGNMIPLTDKMTPDERAAVVAANKEEKDRLEKLALANNAATVEITELREKNWSQLVEIAEKLNADGAKPQIDTGKKQTKGQLIRDILRARGLDGAVSLEQEEGDEK